MLIEIVALILAALIILVVAIMSVDLWKVTFSYGIKLTDIDDMIRVLLSLILSLFVILLGIMWFSGVLYVLG